MKLHKSRTEQILETQSVSLPKEEQEDMKDVFALGYPWSLSVQRPTGSTSGEGHSRIYLTRDDGYDMTAILGRRCKDMWDLGLLNPDKTARVL